MSKIDFTGRVAIVTGAGGGLGGHGEVCGAVIGGLAAIGLLFGRGKVGEEIDMKMWKFSREFMKRFGNEIAGGAFSAATLFK